jgi:hypothetical protein
MEQTASGLLVIGWKLVALFAGSSALTALLVFLVARFAHVFDVYAGERAKLSAQFHNLGRLVEQTEKLTATTESIRARISDEVWDRQMRWSFKRDMYVRLMEALGERLETEARNKLLEQIRRREPHNTLCAAETERALVRSQEIQARLARAACVAPLVISAESHQVLIYTSFGIKKVNYDLPGFESPCDHNLSVLQDGLNRLLVTARKDLGIELTAD